jgi:hypothetical protein
MLRNSITVISPYTDWSSASLQAAQLCFYVHASFWPLVPLVLCDFTVWLFICPPSLTVYFPVYYSSKHLSMYSRVFTTALLLSADCTLCIKALCVEQESEGIVCDQWPGSHYLVHRPGTPTATVVIGWGGTGMLFYATESDCPLSLKPWQFKADRGTAGMVSRKQNLHYSPWKNCNHRVN